MQVVADQKVGLLCIVAGDCVEDPVMLVHDRIPVELLCQYAQPPVALQVHIEGAEPLPDPVPSGDAVERLVELVVAVEELPCPVGRAGILGTVHDLGEQLLARGIDARTALDRDLALEGLAHIACAFDRAQADAAHVGAALGNGLDQSLLPEAYQGFADRGPAHIEIQAQVLDLEPVSGGIGRIQDAFADGLVGSELEALS